MDLQVDGTDCLLGLKVKYNVMTCSLQYALNRCLELTDSVHRVQKEQVLSRAPKILIFTQRHIVA